MIILQKFWAVRSYFSLSLVTTASKSTSFALAQTFSKRKLQYFFVCRRSHVAAVRKSKKKKTIAYHVIITIYIRVVHCGIVTVTAKKSLGSSTLAPHCFLLFLSLCRFFSFDFVSHKIVYRNDR